MLGRAKVTAVLILAATIYFSMVGADAARADSTYNPVYGTKLCNALDPGFFDATLAGNPLCADVKTTGTATDLTTTLFIPQTDLNFSDVVTFIPNGFTISPGASIPTSTTMGGVNAEMGVGLLNGPCTTPGTLIDFILYNVALPNDADPAAATNIAYPDPDGTSNRFFRWHIGSPGSLGIPVEDIGPTDGRADGSAVPITNYPSYLLRMFDPTPGGAEPGTWSDSVVPLAVYGGLTNVAGLWIPVYFAQFSAGQLPALPGAYDKMTANMGQPIVAVLFDPTSRITSPAALSDFCSEVEVTAMLLGDPDGAGVRQTNPATAGTYFWQQYSTSLRDLDQDGYENALDTCPMNPNIPNSTSNTLGPRGPSGSPGDADGDGLWSSCDPNDAVGVGNDGDEDNDNFENRQDNCPLVANGTSSQNETGEVNLVASPDLGPKTDGIGDTCDTGSMTPGASCTDTVPGISGFVAPDTGAPGPDGACQNGRPLSITLASNLGNGRYHASADILPMCIGGTDADGDGYCAGPNDSFDSPNPACPHPACTMVRHQAWGGTHPGQQMDTDGDRITDAMETYLGTDATKSCAQTSTTNDESPLDNWLLDVGNDNGLVNTLDLTGYASALGKYVGEVPAATVRLDFNNDGFISTLDFSGYATALGRSCTGFVCFPFGPCIPAWSQQ